MYLIAFRGRPYLRVPGVAPFPQLADAIAEAKTLFGVVAVPLAILSGPADPRLNAVSLSERAYSEVDAITPLSWAGNAAGSRLTVHEFAALLAAVVIGTETAFGDFPADNSYVLRVRAMNPGPQPGPVTGCEGVAYDYSAALYYDPETDGGGNALPLLDADAAPNAAEPDASQPDPTPGLPAAPSSADIANGVAPVWQWRVQSLADILAGTAPPAFSDPGPADFPFGRFGASQPFILEVQDAGDEAATVVYHGPDETPGAAPPAPILSGVWGTSDGSNNGQETNVATDKGFIEQRVTVQKPAGETWAADGGRLLFIRYGGGFATPDGLLQCPDSRVPFNWYGPVGSPYAQQNGADANSRQAFVSVYDDELGNSEEAPVYFAYAEATYGAGEPRVVEVPNKFGGGFTRTVVWDHQYTVAAPRLDMGVKPGSVPVAPPQPTPTPPTPQPDKNGCVGSANSAGFDPENNEYFITGDRNRLRIGGRVGIIPEVDAGIVTDDAGTALGAVLETLAGTPCTQLGIGLGIGFKGGRPQVAIGLFLEIGTGGPSPFRIPL